MSGASSGLGKSICRLLAEHGVHTIGVDLSPAANETKKLASYVHVTGDVGQEETWLEALETCKTRRPRRIGLVTAAAILHVATIIEESRSNIERILKVNVLGTALAMKSFSSSRIGAHLRMLAASGGKNGSASASGQIVLVRHG